MPETLGKQGYAPIFVVGSPRSGTSILTWCLGQHPNILPLEESDWMGPFAVNVGAHYDTGVRRGERSQLGAMGVARAEFFTTFGRGINELILGHRQQLEQNSELAGKRDPRQVQAEFNISRRREDPKARWVDGTPEYSLYICGLSKLFPDARFVHIVRNARAAVRSMLKFEDNGHRLVENEQRAYEYWLRRVQACVQAEQALGAQTVYRLRYEDLIQQPESAMRGLLEFLNEPFVTACLEPLAKRINSSGVPDSLRTEDPATNAPAIDQALQLSERLQQRAALDPAPAAKAEFEAAFDERVQFIASLPTELDKRTAWALGLDKELIARRAVIAKMERELNLFGVVMVLQVALAIAVDLKVDVAVVHGHKPGTLLWLAMALVGTSLYALFRRAQLRKVLREAIRRLAQKR